MQLRVVLQDASRAYRCDLRMVLQDASRVYYRIGVGRMLVGYITLGISLVASVWGGC